MKNKLTNEDIEAIESRCEERVWEPFPGATIVAWNLPNGFTICDLPGCIDPKNYSREIGVSICCKHLRDKLWMLYGFAFKEQFGKGSDVSVNIFLPMVVFTVALTSDDTMR